MSTTKQWLSVHVLVDRSTPLRPRTLVYSAPELLHGDTYEATAVDVWASGVLLVVSLLGAFPWVCPLPCPSCTTS